MRFNMSGSLSPMPTYNLKQLGEPEIIREINPTVLCAFLKPFEGYLRTRGLEVKEPNRIDSAAIEKLVDVLINPTMKTPQGLLNAVYLRRGDVDATGG